MEDRVPQKPGRVLVTPEGGGDQFYATITRADEPLVEGTPLNANTLLRKVTAAKFGLGADNAVPDKVFDLVAAFVLSGGSSTIHVYDADGQPIKGARIIGIADSAGNDIVTDATGTASAIVQSNIAVVVDSGYADIPPYEYTLTPNFTEVNVIDITLPYATSGQLIAITESGNVKFRRSSTVSISVIGGGNGGTGGTGAYSSGIGQPSFGGAGYGGAGGESGLVYNTTFSATAETVYALAIGAGGLGGAGGARDTSGDSTGDSGSAGGVGGATIFGSVSSTSGSVTTVPFNDSNLMYGGKGGSGGKGALSSGGEDDGNTGSAGVRAGGTGGTGGSNYGSYHGYAGSAGGLGAGGGGGGGGGSRYYYNYCGNGGRGGDGGNGVLLIKF